MVFNTLKIYDFDVIGTDNIKRSRRQKPDASEENKLFRNTMKSYRLNQFFIDKSLHFRTDLL